MASRLRGRSGVAAGLATLLALGACVAAGGDAPATATSRTHWNALGAWEGEGGRQSESFDVTTGSMRLVWAATPIGDGRAGRLRVSLHSSISGRPLATVVDITGEGADTARVTASPRVAYLLIESEGLRWSVTLEEAVTAGQ